MESILDDRDLASYLRDAVGSAEDVEWATGIPAERVHLIAQGFASCRPEESRSLRMLYRCCMFAPLDEGEGLLHWLAARSGLAPAPVALILSGHEQALEALLG